MNDLRSWGCLARAARRASRRAAAGVLAAALCVAPPATLAQFDNLPRLGDAGADELSPQAERRLGDSIMKQVRHDPSYLDDADVLDYLNRFAAVMSATPAAAGHQFDFFALRDPTLNAFALPGGWIGVHAGIITAAQSESEMASVLAHEIGHVVQRHIGRMLSQQRQVSNVAMAAMIIALLAARSSPDAAFGTAMLGDQVARQNLLSFSREAEREADRVGLEILRQAGFDVRAAVSFFGRIQQAGRLFESSAPAYMRTHPMTGERINDLTLRIQDERYRQRVDSPEFPLLRARLRAIGDTSSDGLRNARQHFDVQTRDGGAGADAWYGLAVAAAAQRDFERAREALGEARRRFGRDHPYFDGLEITVRTAVGDRAGALAASRQALERFPDSRALVRLHGDALLANGLGAEAIGFLRDRLVQYRGDGRLWHLLSEAYGRQNQRAEAHRAAAEEFALVGAWQSAVEQLRMAQRAGDADFYTGSMIDARLRDLQAELRRELEEQRASGQLGRLQLRD
jgi:beta-barrel assembly-enhancing protease